MRTPRPGCSVRTAFSLPVQSGSALKSLRDVLRRHLVEERRQRVVEHGLVGRVLREVDAAVVARREDVARDERRSRGGARRLRRERRRARGRARRAASAFLTRRADYRRGRRSCRSPRRCSSLRLAGLLARARRRRVGGRPARVRGRCGRDGLGRGARLGRGRPSASTTSRARCSPRRCSASARCSSGDGAGRRGGLLYTGLAVGVAAAMPVHGAFARTAVPHAQDHVDVAPARRRDRRQLARGARRARRRRRDAAAPPARQRTRRRRGRRRRSRVGADADGGRRRGGLLRAGGGAALRGASALRPGCAAPHPLPRRQAASSRSKNER